jgi:tetratricopeptide (TPR) repeat protein
MTRARTLSHGLAAALVVALSLPAAAGAAADAGVRSLSDLAPVPDGSAGATYLAPLKPQLCQSAASGGAPHTESTAKALKAGEAFLARKASRSALRKALRSRATRKPAGAETTAMAAIGAGKPGSALAALVAGVSANPHDATLLSNASEVLTVLGRPKEGLAFAAAALKAKPHGTGGMGIDQRALALNNQGFALLALRHYAAAVTPLKQAAARAPLLAEARRNLVLAYLCSGQDSQATAAYGDSVHRQTGLEAVPFESPAGLGQGFTPLPGNKQPKAGPVLDLTHGEQATIPALRVPPDPQAGMASADALDSLFRRRHDESLDLARQSSAVSLTVGVTGSQLLRIANIQAVYINWPGQRPDLASGFEQIDSLRQQMDTKFEDTWLHTVPDVALSCTNKPTQAQRDQCYTTTCRSAIDSAHDQWLPIANQANALVHQWGPDYFNFATAVAANTSNQPAHDAIVLLARSQIWGTYSVYVVQRIASWAQAEKGYPECLQAPTTSEAETGAESEPPGIPCPPQLNALDLHINLGVIKFSVNCDSISASTGLPGVVGPFGNVSYSFKSAQTTAFVGLRGGLDQIPGFNVGAKGGVYMTWDAHGNPTDCGLRATGSVGTDVPYDVGPSASGKVQVSLAGTFL